MRKSSFAVIALLLATQVGYGAVKKILIEDLTGAWCQFCPRGPILMEALRVAHPNNIIAITQHGGDKMENVYSRVLYDTAPGFPAFMVNRKLDNNLNAYVNSLNSPAPVAVGITYSWDNTSRKITGTVTAKFESAVTAGDLRIGLMVIEHNVVGTGTGYNQANYYNTTNDYPELKGAGNPIVGYKHYMVCRDCALGGILGKAGIIPNAPVVGTTYSAPFTYTVPAQYNLLNVILNNLYLVAFVGYNAYGKTTTGAILNAEQVKLITAVRAVSQDRTLQGMADNIPKLKSVGAALSFEAAAPGHYTIALYSLSGEKISTIADSYFAAGTHRFSLRNKNNRNGMYVVRVEHSGHSSIARISLTY